MDLKKEIDLYFNKLNKALDDLNREEINIVISLLLKAYESNKQIFICGNGGSAAIASHFACDLNKGLSWGREKKFKVISLTDNIATITAYANDVSYDDIFVEQLKNFINPEDIVLGVSASGNSQNVIKAMEYANLNKAVTIGLCGYDGGKLKTTAAHSIHVNKNDMQVVEDIHSMLGHMLMKILSEVI